MKRRFLAFYLALLLSVGSVFISYSTARADVTSIAETAQALEGGPPVVAAAAYFVAGALIVVSGAAALGSQYGPQIKTQAQNVWNNVDAGTKAAFNTAVTSAFEAGKSTVTITQDMANSLKSAFAGTGAWISALLNQNANAPDTFNMKNPPNCYYYLLGNATSWFLVESMDNQKLTFSYGSSSFVVSNPNSGPVGDIYIYSESKTYNPNPWGNVNINTMWFSGYLAAGGSMTINQLAVPMYANHDSRFAENDATTAVPDGATLDGVINSNLDNLANGVNEVDIPLDNFLYTDPAGTPIEWNPSADAWAYSDGTPYTGDVLVDYPIPNADATTSPTYANPTISLDKADVGGVPVMPDSNPPPDSTADNSTIDWSKLLTAFGSLTDVFPFSIPWDVSSLLSVLNVSPVTPDFPVNVSKTVKIVGSDIPINYKFDINFSAFNDVAMVGRWALVLIWDIAIILALRRLTPD